MNNNTTVFEIYKITNVINGKIYIGLTTEGYKRRFNRHLECSRNANNNRHLMRAIRKYGSENFIIEVIETCTDYVILCEREKYWIKKLKSYERNIGYNMTMGGPGYGPKRDITDIEKQGKRMKEYCANPINAWHVHKFIHSIKSNVKITKEIAEQIKIDRCNKIPCPTIAKTYNVSINIVRKICNVSRWIYVRPDLNDLLLSLKNKCRVNSIKS